MSKHNGAHVDVPIDRIVVDGATEPRINGEYSPKSAEEIPSGFTRVCQGQGWDPEDTWRQLNGGATWYGAPHGAYIYWNTSDGMWWIDEPNGKGVWKAEAPKHAPPQLGGSRSATVASRPLSWPPSARFRLLWSRSAELK